MAVRRNILADADARAGYVEGVRLLKNEFLGPTTEDLGIGGPAVEVSTYDLFVAWHHYAMETFTPPEQTDRNAAHRGPVFLPWHRFMLLLLELQLQRVLANQDFGLPYWDWAADGDLEPGQQPSSAVWADDCMGGEGAPVATGPFAFDPESPEAWRVRVVANVQNRLVTADRGLRRAFGASIGSLPTTEEVAAATSLATYDEPPWGTLSSGFRNQLEGWSGSGPGLHNRVHVWVGGDMLVSSSPNDPVFFLNHCNVDRMWAAWQAEFPDSPYLPDGSEAEDLRGHRIDDELNALISSPVTPRQMLDVSASYEYDTLPVA